MSEFHTLYEPAGELPAGSIFLGLEKTCLLVTNPLASNVLDRNIRSMSSSCWLIYLLALLHVTFSYLFRACWSHTCWHDISDLLNMHAL